MGEDGIKYRVSKIKAGAFTGEVSYYLEQARSAELVAATDAVLYELPYDSLDFFAQDHPDIAATFFKALGERISQKLSKTNQLLIDSKVV